MPFQHRSCDAFHVFALADVAEFVLRTELGSETAQPVLVPRQQDELPALSCESARDRLADPTRRAGDDGYAVYRQTLTCRVEAIVRPAASVAIARSACRPAGERCVFHEPAKRSEPPFRSMSICLPSTKNRTDVIRFVELAATRSPAVLPTHAFAAGVIQVSAGPETPVMRTGWNAVFGWMSLPTELTFFAS